MSRKAKQTSPTPHALRDARQDFRSFWILAAIAAAAFLLRLFYLYQIETIPFFYSLISDARGYNDWAVRIAAGEWLGKEPFYQAPAYPYFLAVIKMGLGDSLFVARIGQCVLGASSSLLIGLAGWGFFSRRCGLVAASLLAVYPPSIFFDGLIQKTSLGQFWGAALLALLAWIKLRPSWKKCAMAGLVLGLFALTRENALVLAPVVGGWLALGLGEGSPRDKSMRVLGLGAGLAIVLMPVGWRNHAVGGQFSLTTFQMGPNFYIGNNAEATGRYRPLVKGHETPEFERADATTLAEEAVGHNLTPHEVSNYWMDQSWSYIQAQPGDWLRLLGIKWLMTWNAYEVPDSENFYIYREWSWLLGTLSGLFHFGVLFPLAVAGVVLSWPRRRELWVLHAIILVMTLAVAGFYVFARYRYPLIPVFMLFAAIGLLEIRTLLHGRNFKALGLCLVPVGVAALLANWPIHPEHQINAMAWGNMGSTLAKQGRIEAATPFFERATAGAPDSAEMHYNLGLAYLVQQRCSEAAQEFKEALRIDSALIELEYQLATALECAGKPTEAMLHYRKALEQNPNDADAQSGINRLTDQAE